MSTLTRTVAVGAFLRRDEAEAAVQELRREGFDATDIGIAARNANGQWTEYASVPSDASNAGAGAAAGAAAGAGVGGLWALGIAAGILPAIGPVVAGGLLASILASAAAGATAGGLAGALIGIGVSEDEARHYEEELASGRTVVTVRAGSRYDLAVRILESNGAQARVETR